MTMNKQPTTQSRLRRGETDGAAPEFGWQWIRPYLLAMVLASLTLGLFLLGESALLPYGFPWSLASLLVITAVAHLWGRRPAIFVLIASTIAGDILVPELHIPDLQSHDVTLQMTAVRHLLFLGCGAATIWLTYQARKNRAKSEQRKTVVEALQRMILPDRLEQASGYDVVGSYQPAYRDEEVGGDFYDFYRIEEGRYGLMIGDVMGKGKEAAAFTAVLRYSIRAFAGLGYGPAEILRHINSQIENQKIEMGTATLFVGILEVCSGAFTYASAGHEPALLLRGHGGEETLDATGMVVGVGPDMEYEAKRVFLAPGDSLLLMTDGVTEARNDQGDFLDSQGARALLRSALSAGEATGVLAALEYDLRAYIGDNSHDDIAMVLLQRRRDALSNTARESAPAEAESLCATGSRP